MFRVHVTLGNIEKKKTLQGLSFRSVEYTRAPLPPPGHEEGGVAARSGKQKALGSGTIVGTITACLL